VKKVLLVIFLLPAVFSAYELGLLHMEVPSPLPKMSAEFDMEHRFYGSLTDDPFSSLFGLYYGANSYLALKFAPIKGLEISCGRKSTDQEWTAGVSYSHRFPAAFIRGRLGIEFFTYNDPEVENNPANFFYQVGLQSEPILGRIKPVVTAAFDGYNQRFGLGAGISVLAFQYVWYFEEISLLAEYYPVFGREGQTWLGERNAFVIGLGLSTSGHQFLLSVGNTWDVSARRLMLGTSSDGLHIGLGIKRVFKF